MAGNRKRNERKQPEKAAKEKKAALRKKYGKYFRIGGAVLLIALAAVLLIPGRQRISAEKDTGFSEKQVIAIEVADYGTIKAELYPDAAPLTVENFLKLADGHFYDGLTFHRIIKGFMIQGGDPEGNGTGGSKDRIKGEFSSNGWTNPLKHTRGVLSMARSSDPNSASSQFFIMHEDAPHLDGQYAAFGKVIEGMEVVDAICDRVTAGYNGAVEKKDQPVITRIFRMEAPAENGAE